MTGMLWSAAQWLNHWIYLLPGPSQWSLFYPRFISMSSFVNVDKPLFKRKRLGIIFVYITYCWHSNYDTFPIPVSVAWATSLPSTLPSFLTIFRARAMEKASSDSEWREQRAMELVIVVMLLFTLAFVVVFTKNHCFFSNRLTLKMWISGPFNKLHLTYFKLNSFFGSISWIWISL